MNFVERLEEGKGKYTGLYFLDVFENPSTNNRNDYRNVFIIRYADMCEYICICMQESVSMCISVSYVHECFVLLAQLFQSCSSIRPLSLCHTIRAIAAVRNKQKHANTNGPSGRHLSQNDTRNQIMSLLAALRRAWCPWSASHRIYYKCPNPTLYQKYQWFWTTFPSWLSIPWNLKLYTVI